MALRPRALTHSRSQLPPRTLRTSARASAPRAASLALNVSSDADDASRRLHPPPGQRLPRGCCRRRQQGHQARRQEEQRALDARSRARPLRGARTPPPPPLARLPRRPLAAPLMHHPLAHTKLCAPSRPSSAGARLPCLAWPSTARPAAASAARSVMVSTRIPRPAAPQCAPPPPCPLACRDVLARGTSATLPLASHAAMPPAPLPSLQCIDANAISCSTPSVSTECARPNVPAYTDWDDHDDHDDDDGEHLQHLTDAAKRGTAWAFPAADGARCAAPVVPTSLSSLRRISALRRPPPVSSLHLPFPLADEDHHGCPTGAADPAAPTIPRLPFYLDAVTKTCLRCGAGARPCSRARSPLAAALAWCSAVAACACSTPGHSTPVPVHTPPLNWCSCLASNCDPSGCDSTGACFRCAAGTGRASLTDRTCVAGSLPGCIKYSDGDAMRCKQCAAGYSLGWDSQCAPCSVSGCAACSSKRGPAVCTVRGERGGSAV